jgi:hypothetical protein
MWTAQLWRLTLFGLEAPPARGFSALRAARRRENWIASGCAQEAIARANFVLRYSKILDT